MEESLPPGFRFHPTDEELITYYLTPKVSNTSFSSRAIADVDLNKCEPWDLPGKASMGEKEWYFFSLRDRKYPTGIRTNRATEAGYWKTTGKDKEIYRGGMLVGMKKTLVFYKGRAPKGEKSNWVMHEYRMETKHSFKPKKEEWVVCRVFKKSSAVKKPHQLTTGQSSLPSLESPCDTNTNISEFGDIELPSGFNNNTNTNYVNGGDHDNLNMNNLNWVASAAAAAAGREGTSMVPSVLPWPSSLLSPNLEMNSLLIKALQLGSYRPREATNVADHQNYSYLPAQGISNFGNTASTTTDHLICSNFQPPPSSSSSSFKALDYSLHQHQHQLQQHQEEQPFNLDSINW